MIHIYPVTTILLITIGIYIFNNHFNKLKHTMAKLKDTLEELKATVSELVTASDSATALIEGFTARLEKAIAAATEAGATEAQLSELKSLNDLIVKEKTELASAVEANTPSE